MKKARNHQTGVVHGLTGRKIGIASMYEKVCGGESHLFWLKVDKDEPITCTKCKSILAYNQKED